MEAPSQNDQRVVSEYTIFVHNTIDFYVEGLEKYRTYGVSLFNFYLSTLYRDKNYLVENRKVIEIIQQVIKGVYPYEPDFGGFQHELYIECSPEFTYLEKWGLEATITTEQFLQVFYDIESFLLRWMIMSEIIKEITKTAEQGHQIGPDTKEFITDTGDKVRLLLPRPMSKEETFDHIVSLSYPIHLRKQNEDKLQL